MKIDVVIPSLSTKEYHQMITNCIRSLRQSEPQISFNIIIVESGPEIINFGQDDTVKFDLPKFNFNHALKQGIARCNCEWIVLANNDLVFHKNWMTEILATSEKNPDVESFSPWEPRFHPANEAFKPLQKMYFGYSVPGHIAGWCIATKAHVLSKLDLTEEVAYWCSDNVYADELQRNGIKHALLRNSVVTHLFERTTSKLKNKKEMTYDQKEVYEKIKTKARQSK